MLHSMPERGNQVSLKELGTLLKDFITKVLKGYLYLNLQGGK